MIRLSFLSPYTDEVIKIDFLYSYRGTTPIPPPCTNFQTCHWFVSQLIFPGNAQHNNHAPKLGSNSSELNSPDATKVAKAHFRNSQTALPPAKSYANGDFHLRWRCPPLRRQRQPVHSQHQTTKRHISRRCIEKHGGPVHPQDPRGGGLGRSWRRTWHGDGHVMMINMFIGIEAHPILVVRW